MLASINAFQSSKPDEHSRRSRPTFGFVVRWGFTNHYSSPMWWEAVEAAKALDVNLVGVSAFDFAELQRNRSLFCILQPPTLDGLILVNPDNPGLHREMFQSLPVVNIAAPAEDVVTSIVVDNYGGMYTAVRHLIEIHGCRRLAFITGAANSIDAEARFRAYMDALQAYGLTMDPNLVYHHHIPDWSPPVGRAGVRALLERDMQFDALVAANDNMAMPAMDELRLYGLRVPDDVAVIGFDDVTEARTSMPPLTTVHQPLREMGRMALEALLLHYQGKSVPQELVPPTTLIVRRSCGCPSQAVLQAVVPIHHSVATPDAASNNQQDKLLALVCDAVQSSGLSTSDIRQALDAFHQDMLADSVSAFLLVLTSLLERALLSWDDAVAWQNALSVLRTYSHHHYGGADLLRAENLISQARVLTTEVAQSVYIHQRLQVDEQTNRLRETSGTLMTTFEMPSLMDILAEQLPALGFPGCYLSLYEDPKQPDAWSNLQMAFHANGRVELPREGLRYPTPQLVPPECVPPDRQFSWVVEPLYFKERQLGLVVLEAGPREGSAYNSLRAQISSALQAIQLVQQEQSHALQLDITARDLERSNAELEQFAYVASHDLQEPLRMVASYLQLIERRYKGQLDQDADEFIAFAVDGAIRMKTLIGDLLTYSRVGTHSKPFEPFDCATILERTLANLKVAIEERNAVVTHDPMPTVMADDVQLSQVFQNLIGNAIKFHSEGTQPEVHIGVVQRDTGWVFSVRDNGIGIDPQHFKRIFMVFQRLHNHQSYPGTGIGLAVCKKIVERHGGHIWVESEPGKGSTFFFMLPVTGYLPDCGRRPASYQAS